MATRIRIRNTDGTGEYQLPINPIEIGPPETEQYVLKDALDGQPVKQKPSFDGRQRWWRWDPMRTTGSSWGTQFDAMISTLRGYIGKQKEVKLEDADYLGWYASYGWMEIDVDDVEVGREAGSREYLNVKFIYHFIQNY